jgi:hypothetical protein
MKASNKFRATHTFSIVAGVAHDVAVIAAKYGKKLVSVSHEHKPKGDYVSRHSYVLRLLDNHDLVDIAAYVDSGDAVIEVQRVVVIEGSPVKVPDFSYSGDTLRAHTEAARKWVEKNFMPDRSYTGNAHFVDPSFIGNIETKIKAAGLSILIP